MTIPEAVPTTVDLRKYIDRQFFGERPHIRGRRVLVSTVAGHIDQNGWNIAEVARNLTLREEEVLAALLYYREHRAEIDLQDATEQQRWDEMVARQSLSGFDEKL
jgi:uncharacterized protein (DUF433 family)